MKNFFKTEWGKLKELDFAGKRQYIWEYYRLHMFGIAFVAFILGSFINAWLNPSPDEYLYVAWFGPPAFHGQLDVMSDALSVIVSDPEREIVQITNYDMGGDPQIVMAMQTRLFALLQSAAIDVFIAPREGIESFTAEGILRPVDDVLHVLAQINPALYQTTSERLLTVPFAWTEGGETAMEAMGISMYGMDFFYSAGISPGDLYLGVVFNSERFYEIARALEVILHG